MAILKASRSFSTSIIAGVTVFVGFFAMLFASAPSSVNFYSGEILGGVAHADAPAACSCTDAGCACDQACGCGCDGCGCAG